MYQTAATEAEIHEAEVERLRAEAVAAANDVTPAVVSPVVETKPIASREQRKDDAQARKEINERKRPVKKELDAAEKNIATFESERTQLHELLASPITPAEIAEAGKRLKVVEDELASLEARWLELTEQIESIENALA